MADDLLYWSARGEVACGSHAPVAEPERWNDERWQRVPDFMFVTFRKRLQCQYCPTAVGRPLGRREMKGGSDEPRVA